jgi:penicillin-binding protein 2
MAVEGATLANGGKVYQPYRKQRPAGMPEPEPVRRIKCRADDFELVRKGMRDVVSGAKGTGKALANLPVACAGKTGTAQIGNDLKNTWVLAFAPYENPTVALALLVEHGESGGKTAAPRARNVLAAKFGERD